LIFVPYALFLYRRTCSACLGYFIEYLLSIGNDVALQKKREFGKLHLFCKKQPTVKDNVWRFLQGAVPALRRKWNVMMSPVNCRLGVILHKLSGRLPVKQLALESE
jgi:hypothetical protein